MPSKIKKRGENSYLLTVSGGYTAERNQNTYTKTIYCDNITEAENQYTLFAADCFQGKVIAAGTNRMTLKQFYDYWKEKFANNRYAKTTLVCYDQMFLRISAALGHLRIDKIKPVQIIDFFAQLASLDAKKDNTPLAVYLSTEKCTTIATEKCTTLCQKNY